MSQVSAARMPGLSAETTILGRPVAALLVWACTTRRPSGMSNRVAAAITRMASTEGRHALTMSAVALVWVRVWLFTLATVLRVRFAGGACFVPVLAVRFLRSQSTLVASLRRKEDR